jgi:hypothetical protein
VTAPAARTGTPVTVPAEFLAETAAHLEAATAELDRLRAVEAAARAAMAKVAEHEAKGWERIRVGAFDALRDALAGGAR